MRIFLHCRCVESFFGDVLIGSSETALGGTIFTAALADCGLVKKAMVDREVKRRKKEQGVRWRGEVNRHPHRPSSA
jgi:hypothetical protein